MPDMTGSLLIHGGLVKPDAVKEARTLATRSGATLGECLVAIGAVDEEALAEFFHRRLMIPRLDERRLSNVPVKILGLVPPDMAVEFRVVPVGLAEGNLLLAMSDPSDNHAVDEIGFFAGHFVLRHGATESAVHGAIERLYNVRLPNPTAPIALVKRVTPLPPPEPPTSEELFSDAPIALTKPKLVSVPKPTEPAPPPEPIPQLHDSLDDENEDEGQPVLLLTKKKVDEPAPILLTKPVAPPPVEPPASSTTGTTQTRERDTLPQFQAVALPDAPLAALRAAVNREEIAVILLDYFSQLSARTILLAAQKEMLTGKDGRNVEASMVRQLAVPLSASSIFRDVVASRLPYRGPLPGAGGDLAFAHTLGGVRGDILIMPVAVRDRIVAVVYADGTRPPLPDAALHATTREAGLAYERIILRAKR